APPQRRRPGSLAGFDAESEVVAERFRALHGDSQRPGPRLASDPSALEQARREPDSQWTGNVIASLRPVEAGRPLQQPVRLLEEPERDAGASPRRGEREASSVTPEKSALHERVDEADPQLAREVPVAGPRPAEGRVVGVLGLATDRSPSEQGEALEG